MGRHSNGHTASFVSELPGRHRDGTEVWEALKMEPLPPTPPSYGVSPDAFSPFEYIDMLALGYASNANETNLWVRELRSDDK